MSVGYNRLISRPLMLKRTLRVVELFSQSEDWGEVRRIVFEQNIFQSNKTATISADFSEIKRRLDTLSPEAITLLHSVSIETARYINLISIFNVYPSFREFMSEFVFNRVQFGNMELVLPYYLQFLEDLKFRDEKLRQKKDVTLRKSAEFVFQILRETGILMGSTVVIPFLPFQMEKLPEMEIPEIRRALLQ